MDPRPPLLPCRGNWCTRTRYGLSQRSAARWPWSPLEAHLLIELENGPATNQQLAERLRIDKSNASRPWPASPGGADRLATPPLGRAQQGRRASPSRARHSLRAAPADGRDHGGAWPSSPRRVASRSGRACGSIAAPLSRARRQQGFVIRPITRPTIPGSPPWCAPCSAEYGLTADKVRGGGSQPRFSPPETYQVYSRYWRLRTGRPPFSAGGIAPLAGQRMC